jgi:mandelamide amidase
VNYNLADLSIIEALTGLKNKKFSCLEYINALLLNHRNSLDLNAFISIDIESLQNEAKAIDNNGNAGIGLCGIPIVLKDNINTIRLPTSAGTAALKNNFPGDNSPVAGALFKAGALLGGKGNMHELAFGITSNNAITGATRNPWNHKMIPGGSSGGVAAAVAGRIMPGGIGTDTGASVRLPAALCGVVGFRPTIGRYSAAGIIPISHTRDTAGPITRTVADARLLDAIICGHTQKYIPVKLNELRIGIPFTLFQDNLEADVRKETNRIIAQLESAGVTLIEENIVDVEKLHNLVSLPIALFEFLQDLSQYLKKYQSSLTILDIFEGIGSPDVKSLVASQMGAGAISKKVYLKALNVDRPKLQRTYALYFEKYNLDAILFPTSPITARPIGEDKTVKLNGKRKPTFSIYTQNVGPASVAGIPGISIPTGLSSSGLPIGMELDGPANSDARLLIIAQAISDLINFTSKPPKLSEKNN